MCVLVCPRVLAALGSGDDYETTKGTILLQNSGMVLGSQARVCIVKTARKTEVTIKLYEDIVSKP